MRLLACAMAMAAAALGQTGPEIIKKTAETYASLKSYQFEAQVVSETVSENNESRTRSTRAAAAMLPDRRRIESKGQQSTVRIYDGHDVWEYRAGPKQFSRQDQATFKPPMMNMVSDPVDQYKMLEKMGTATLVREEDGCWVVEVATKFPASGPILERRPNTYWIDKSTYLIKKEVQGMKIKMPNMDVPQDQSTTTTYTLARVNQPVPDELFKFQPPDGAAQVAEFNSPFGGGSVLVGKALPDFTLPDLAGKDVTFESLKGKPLLVNFWATWCAPCREQMPKIQQLTRDFAEKGLVVVAINDGEDAATAAKYIDEHKYAFRVLLDKDKAFGKKLSVNAIPAVFLIDRDGTVKAQFTGYNTSVDLKEELKRIGL